MPYKGDTVVLYKNFNDTSDVVTTLPEGVPVEILERRLGVAEARAEIWHHVRTEDGIEGWSYGPNYIPALRELRDGSLARLSVTGADKAPLLASSSPLSVVVKYLHDGDMVTVVRIEQQSTFIQMQDGTHGWLNRKQPGSDGIATLIGLPWKPVPITDDMLAPSGPTDTPEPTLKPVPTSSPAPSATPQWICSGTVSTRLTIGGKGRVSPGKANRVRAEPGGTSLGNIPVGAIFDVLDGPRCTADGTVWWKVNYNSLEGWTAEGDSGAYWLEPTQ